MVGGEQSLVGGDLAQDDFRGGKKQIVVGWPQPDVARGQEDGIGLGRWPEGRAKIIVDLNIGSYDYLNQWKEFLQL